MLLARILTLTAILFCSELLLLKNASLAETKTQDEQHEPAIAATQFEIHPDVKVSLFAAEPFLANPTNIDIDHLGRVWVCEVINYRHRIANGDIPERDSGDRILILEDTNGDGKCDKETVFYQGRDIDSAHGICVLGDRALVSANDSVFFLIDENGDSKADKKEILFTGIGGTQHDHGIHAFVFGPDGKLYFNFGNEGKQICDADGKPIVDMAGNVVNNQRKPYQQGMVFRCNLDGSEFETLAWNFRNNWEVAIDSFGTLWQSDNDDDGNRGVRINYVMPFGNYGYRDEMTGAGWREPRTGMCSDVPSQHWHQNDPGVMPNLLQTGAGSPTGICIYEGSRLQLPEIFHGQMIHCDAGPNIVRAYPTQTDGAGYTATIVNIMDGAKQNQWFRPSDVCVAPDGSLIVADWYDPGVGGHRMRDVERGRLFRVSSKFAQFKGDDQEYRITPLNLSSIESAFQALVSPNPATRFLAWQAFHNFDDANGIGRNLLSGAITNTDLPARMRARWFWALGKSSMETSKKIELIKAMLKQEEPDLRITALRLATQIQNEIPAEDIADAIRLDDESPAVRRELLIAMRYWNLDNHANLWAALANQYPANDRWYLEALGIAAEGRWDDCLSAWLTTQASPRKAVATPRGKDIAWRSRGTTTPELLELIIRDETTTVADLPRYFRAFDLLPVDKAATLTQLGFDNERLEPAKASYVTMESVARLDPATFNEAQTKKLDELIESSRGSSQFVNFVNRFSSIKHFDELVEISATSNDAQLAADAISALMDQNQQGRVHKFLRRANDEQAEATMTALVNSGKRRAAHVLGGFGKRKDLGATPRQQTAIKRLGQIHSGCRDLLRWLDTKPDEFDEAIMPAVIASLHSSPFADIRAEANKRFPLPAAKDDRPLPSITELANQKGDAKRGQKVFAGIGTCATCHQVGGQGTNVGPDLSEIGSKLTREALYESILFPSAGISHNYENWMVLTEDGQLIVGLVLSETAKQIQIIDAKGIRHTIDASQIEEKKKQKLSLMPADLHRAMTQQELIDVVEYMTELRGITRKD